MIFSSYIPPSTIHLSPSSFHLEASRTWHFSVQNFMAGSITNVYLLEDTSTDFSIMIQTDYGELGELSVFSLGSSEEW